MCRIISGDLGPTATYTFRDFTWLAGVGWEDGRDGTIWFNHFSAKSRLGSKNKVSQYSVGEVKLVGFNGRAWVFNKLYPENEYGDGRADTPKPPYTVTLDRHGGIKCQCMAAVCNAPTCRHCDAVLALLDAGEFEEPVTVGA